MTEPRTPALIRHFTSAVLTALIGLTPTACHVADKGTGNDPTPPPVLCQDNRCRWADTDPTPPAEEPPPVECTGSGPDAHCQWTNTDREVTS
ncbi:hypothetical protein AB0B45_22270 [Nonomuraea sp. NPDC049152]|uniref:hypothetical protein n=1 Tax=Nonomuraea sp. NPDC049152 TaxID=3154350 RepID=UPI0033EA1415